MLDAASSDRAVRLIRRLEDRYAFLGMLGKGGSGLVFEVQNRQLRRKEALKILGQIYGRDDGQRFAHEAKLMAALDHPHIIPIYAFGEDAGNLWYSMKLVEGPTLARYLTAALQPGLAETCQVAIPVLEALALSHSRGIIHRDIKPANILLDPAAGPLLTDFGIAKAESDPMMTETGLVLGTPAYVSPEQCLGQAVDGRTDLYALAVSLYQFLAGRLPFEEGNSLAMVIQRFREDAIPLGTLRPDLPDPLTDIITKSMQRRPEDRFASAQDMKEAFLHLANLAGVDWKQPLRLPHGLGPKRSPLPEAFLVSASQEATVALPARSGGVDANASTRALQGRQASQSDAPGKAPGRRLWLAALLLPIAALGAWVLTRPPQSMPPFAPAPAAGQAETLRTPGPAPRPLQKVPVNRQEKEPPPTRRAVTPPQLLETPKVLLPEGSPCGGQSVTVELQVDEAGLVTEARLLSKIPAGCADSILRAAKGCRFKPALASDGKPVATTLAIALEP